MIYERKKTPCFHCKTSEPQLAITLVIDEKLIEARWGAARSLVLMWNWNPALFHFLHFLPQMLFFRCTRPETRWCSSAPLDSQAPSPTSCPTLEVSNLSLRPLQRHPLAAQHLLRSPVATTRAARLLIIVCVSGIMTSGRWQRAAEREAERCAAALRFLRHCPLASTVTKMSGSR